MKANTLSGGLKGLLLLGLCLGYSYNGTAQKKMATDQEAQKKADAVRSDQTAGNSGENFHTFDLRYRGVKGSPYLDKGWQWADVQAQGKTLTHVPVRYDILNNNLRLMQRPGDSIILATNQVKEFSLYETVPGTGRLVFRHYTFQNNGKVVDAYFEPLAEAGNLTLLKLRKKNIVYFNKEREASTYSAQNNFDKIEDHVEYYVYGPNNTAVLVKPNRKSLEKALEQLGAANRQDSGAKKAEIRSEQELVTAFRLISNS